MMACQENSLNRTQPGLSNYSNSPLLRLRADQVFDEVSAIISEPVLDLFPNSHRDFFERLLAEAGVSMESTGANRAYVIKGGFEQILLAKIKLEKYVIDLQMSILTDQFGQCLSPGGGSPSKQTKQNKTSIKLKKVQQRSSGPKHGKTTYQVLKPGTPTQSPVKGKSRRKVGRPRKIPVPEDVVDHGPGEMVVSTPETDNMIPMENSYLAIPPIRIKQEPIEDAFVVYKDNSGPSMMEESEYSAPTGGPTLAQSLEAEAERKAAEWLSINLQTQQNNETSTMDDSVDEPKDSTVDEQFEYSCELCSFKAQREGQFLKHVLIHGKDTVHKCDKCDFASVSHNHFQRHKLSHSDSIFKCPQCSYQTDEAKQLARHVTLKHTMVNNPPKRSSVLQCNECPYSTTKIYHFERHLLVHNRDLKGLLQVYHCEQCPYRTHRKEHYLRHRDNVHLRHRPYQCNMCSRSYKRDDALQQHQVSVHNVYPQFSRLPESTISSILDMAMAGGATAASEAAAGLPATSASESSTTLSLLEHPNAMVGHERSGSPGSPGSPGTPNTSGMPESRSPSPLSISPVNTLIPVSAIP